MAKQIFIASAAMVLLTLSACASIPTPEKICSAEWITLRADHAMKDFKRDTKSIFKRLKKAGNSYMDNGRIGPLQMIFLMSSINKLADKFEHGRSMRDIRTLASTCNDPTLIKNAMTEFMREQGLNARFINFVNDLDVYKEMIKTGKKPKLKL
ncbi:MAG: hypothetical protein V3U57_04680 [Robiginitomaculum sp.]